MTGEPPNHRMLTSWKEIATFFDRDARTVQRWEKEGLPIHRHRHRRQSSIYAYAHELDAWWRERADVAHLDTAPAAAPPAGPLSTETEMPEAARAGDASGATRARTGWIPRLVTRRVTVAAVAGIAGVLLVTGIQRAMSARRTPGSTQLLAMLDGQADGVFGLSPISDLNGDGRNDLVVATADRREIHLLFGGSIPAGGQLTAAAGVTIRGTEHAHYHAGGVADVDGDGLRDLLVSASLNEPEAFKATGATYLLRGRRAWPRLLQLPQAADVTFRFTQPKNIGLSSYPQMGPADFNRDGIEDLVLGGADFSPPGHASAGAIFVLFGRRGWPAAVDVERDADVTIHGSRAGEALASGCNVGDFNGDGRPDLAALAMEHTLWNMLGQRGRYYVFLGRDSWPRTLTADRDADFRIDGEQPGSANHAPVLADLNGDGFDDLVIGTTASAAQPAVDRFAVFLGAPTRTGVLPMSAADAIIASDSVSPAAFTTADLDRDDVDDLILAGRGGVHLLFGRSQWPPRSDLARLGVLELFSRESGPGSGVVRVGDLSGDGLPEIAMSAAAATGGSQSTAQRLWLLTPHRPIRLDVRPGFEPNILYLPGVLVAMVAGQSGGNGDAIEPASVRLSGAAPVRTEWRDFDQDGTADLLAYFETRGMKVTPRTTRVSLTARTRSGQLVAGHDAVTVMTGTADQLSEGRR